MYEESNLVRQIGELLDRIAALESRVARLEAQNRPTGHTGPLSSAHIAIPNSETSNLAESIATVLQEVGEADATTIRQHLVKKGLPDSLSRSDVNKILYANKARFEISRQDGVKPYWHLVQ